MASLAASSAVGDRPTRACGRHGRDRAAARAARVAEHARNARIQRARRCIITTACTITAERAIAAFARLSVASRGRLEVVSTGRDENHDPEALVHPPTVTQDAGAMVVDRRCVPTKSTREHRGDQRALLDERGQPCAAGH